MPRDAVADPSSGVKYSRENNDLPALFWEDAIPEDQDHPDLAGMMAIMEECTPAERAEALKCQGNDAFKFGKGNHYYYREAIKCYAAALAVPDADDVGLRATCLSNRAEAHLRLENWGHALSDAQASCVEQPENNGKAYLRAAKAARKLGKFEKAAAIARLGAQRCRDEGNAKFADELDGQAAAADNDKRVHDQRRILKEVGASARLGGAELLAQTALAKGVQLGPFAYEMPEGCQPAFAVDDEAGKDENGLPILAWPVLLLYGESMQKDVLSSVPETAVVADLLDEVFSTPPDWDDACSYLRERVELYFQQSSDPARERLDAPAIAREINKRALEPYGALDPPPDLPELPPSRSFVRIDESSTIADVVSDARHVVPGVLVLHVLARDTTFRAHVLSGRWAG